MGRKKDLQRITRRPWEVMVTIICSLSWCGEDLTDVWLYKPVILLLERGDERILRVHWITILTSQWAVDSLFQKQWAMKKEEICVYFWPPYKHKQGYPFPSCPTCAHKNSMLIGLHLVWISHKQLSFIRVGDLPHSAAWLCYTYVCQCHFNHLNLTNATNKQKRSFLSYPFQLTPQFSLHILKCSVMRRWASMHRESSL